MSGYTAKFYGGPKNKQQFEITEKLPEISFPCYKTQTFHFLTELSISNLVGRHIYKLADEKDQSIYKHIVNYDYVETKWN